MRAISLVAIIGAGVALGTGNIVLALGIGGVWLVLFWLASPSRPRRSSSVLTLDEFDQQLNREIQAAKDPAEARYMAVSIGLAVAVGAVNQGLPFDEAFRRFQSTSETVVEDALHDIVVTLFAADTMRTQTWKQSLAIQKLRGDGLDAEVKSWRTQRLRTFERYRMRDFAALMRDASFRAFARDMAAWTKHELATAPRWWTDTPA